MKVKDIMTKDVKYCTPDTTLAEAAHLMWEADCGILPVVDGGALEGVITDRDMYIALATKNARASQLKAGAIATKTVLTCGPDDDVHLALSTMKEARVRRLPVVDADKTLTGILSMNDIVLAAAPGSTLSNDDVLDVLRVVCAHPRSPVTQVAAA